MLKARFKQHLFTIVKLLLIASLFPMTASQAADEQSIAQPRSTTNGYIKDELFVYIHAGSSKQFKIIGSINAGTPIELLDQDPQTGFIQIKDDRDRIGWIEKDNYSAAPSLQVKFDQLQSRYDEIVSSEQEYLATINQLNNQLKAAQTATEQSKTQQLKLEKDRQSLHKQLTIANDQKELKKLIYGAGICILGLLLGLLLPMILPKRRRSDHWV